jgi:nitrogenase molybdenum-iron protein alpha/beta subunit
VKEVQSSSGQVIVLQIHGFHTSKHDGYPQAVLGFGKNIESVELAIGKELEDIFEKQGIGQLCAEIMERLVRNHEYPSSRHERRIVHPY